VGKRSARAMAHYEQTSKEELMKVYRDIESHYPQ
jgi:hypothetical protein